MLRRNKAFLVLLFALLIPVAVVFAADSVILGDNEYQVDLVSQDDNGDSTSTFTYAVTGLQPLNALSHWTLGIETCLDEFLVSPQNDDDYTTPTDIAECGDGTYTCESSTYTVVEGNDPTIGIFGLKFEVQNGEPQITSGVTHIFQITVNEPFVVDLVDVGAKSAASEPQGSIDGPVCGGQTAINLSSTTASSATANVLLPAVLLLAGLAATSLVLWRRQSAAA